MEEIPGIGPVTATAPVATMGAAQAFHSGRAFAASLDLVPRQSGTANRFVSKEKLRHMGAVFPCYRRLLHSGQRCRLTWPYLPAVAGMTFSKASRIGFMAVS